jgi:hypothetical protein
LDDDRPGGQDQGGQDVQVLQVAQQPDRAGADLGEPGGVQAFRFFDVAVALFAVALDDGPELRDVAVAEPGQGPAGEQHVGVCGVPVADDAKGVGQGLLGPVGQAEVGAQVHHRPPAVLFGAEAAGSFG